jgi:hypothetical protein
VTAVTMLQCPRNAVAVLKLSNSSFKRAMFGLKHGCLIYIDGELLHRGGPSAAENVMLYSSVLLEARESTSKGSECFRRAHRKLLNMYMVLYIEGSTVLRTYCSPMRDYSF